MTQRNQKRLTVWLGLIAVWLLVVAPLVSHFLVATRASATTDILCSATLQPENRDYGNVDGNPQHPSAPHSDACGYCSVLEHHGIAPGAPLVTIYLSCLVVAFSVVTLVLGFTPVGAFPAARPRAPPLTL
jgi:hypothetical protein